MPWGPFAIFVESEWELVWSQKLSDKAIKLTSTCVRGRDLHPSDGQHETDRPEYGEVDLFSHNHPLLDRTDVKP
jgi:hypothetical protein